MKPTETILIFTIFFLSKWNNCFYYSQKSTYPSWFGCHFLLRTLVLPFSCLTLLSLHQIIPTNIHTASWIPSSLCSPIVTSLFSMFTISTSSSLYSIPMSLLFLYFTVASILKATKSCFHVAKCHGHFLSSFYSTLKQQWKV